MDELSSRIALSQSKHRDSETKYGLALQKLSPPSLGCHKNKSEAKMKRSKTLFKSYVSKSNIQIASLWNFKRQRNENFKS